MDEATAQELLTLIWAFKLAIIPTVTFSFAVIWLLRDIKKSTDRLLYMHYNPDKFGFGNGALGEEMTGLRNATRDVAHYTKWMATNMNNGKPPPPRLDT